MMQYGEDAGYTMERMKYGKYEGLRMQYGKDEG